MGNQQSVWDSVYETGFENAKAIQREVLQMVNEQATETELTEFVLRKQREFARSNQAILEEVWNKYDADRNGELSLAECELMIRDSLVAGKPWIPKMVSELMEESFEIAFRNLPEESQARMREERARLSPKLKEVVVAEINQMVLRAPQIARDLCRLMDLDANGRIDKREFLAAYSEASAQVVDMSKMIETMIERMNQSLAASNDDEDEE
eukprot:TRINITY_DN4731_c0_g1_i2.p1 TRINITY_DN4731_c0_g1~~TRINITY_DN4731_c0_g1_i2.p1  ORF type:complete len:210 (-),score=75.14 TRINITY_DN4731_c0_g1_i2:200-829(-)